MSHVAEPPSGRDTSSAGEDPSAGELVSRLSSEVSQLVRDELRLAQAEMSGKAKKAGIGAGMFGAAGLLALYGGGVLITTAILALALAVDAWLAALIVASSCSPPPASPRSSASSASRRPRPRSRAGRWTASSVTSRPSATPATTDPNTGHGTTSTSKENAR